MLCAASYMQRFAPRRSASVRPIRITFQCRKIVSCNKHATQINLGQAFQSLVHHKRVLQIVLAAVPVKWFF